ncbi:MAG: elongation factor P [bacterium]|nr:elongation factor P [bacterium]
MLNHTDLKKGVIFVLEKQPYEVLESAFVFKGRGSSVVQTKIKNLILGNLLSRTFHPGDNLEEAEIEKINVKFVYLHKGKFVFSKEDNSSVRFELPKEVIGDSADLLKPNEVVEGMVFEGKIINISLPIKVQIKVTEAPPGIRGDRAQGGTKVVTLETGAQINVPLFVEQGDVVEVNTESREYVKRVE